MVGQRPLHRCFLLINALWDVDHILQLVYPMDSWRQRSKTPLGIPSNFNGSLSRHMPIKNYGHLKEPRNLGVNMLNHSIWLYIPNSACFGPFFPAFSAFLNASDPVGVGGILTSAPFSKSSTLKIWIFG